MDIMLGSLIEEFVSGDNSYSKLEKLADEIIECIEDNEDIYYMSEKALELQKIDSSDIIDYDYAHLVDELINDIVEAFKNRIYEVEYER